MITKDQLLTLLSLPADADLAAVREKVRVMEDRTLDAVAAQAVMGWKCEETPWNVDTKTQFCIHYETGCVMALEHEHYSSMVEWEPTEDLNIASALAPKIEEMGLWREWCLEMLISESFRNPADFRKNNDDDRLFFLEWNFANATARQRTEDAVLAVAGRVLQ